METLYPTASVNDSLFETEAEPFPEKFYRREG